MRFSSAPPVIVPPRGSPLGRIFVASGLFVVVASISFAIVRFGLPEAPLAISPVSPIESAPLPSTVPSTLTRLNAQEPAAPDPTITLEPTHELPVVVVRPSPGFRASAPRTREEDPRPSRELRREGPAPEAPAREQVVSALEQVRPALLACVGDRHGLASVRLTVSPTGRVRHAVVTGDFDGTPEGSCIARTVRSAQFPPFTQESFSVRYPFQL